MSTASVTCINGMFVPAATAALPVSDRLVRLGDGVFETIRIENYTPYQWEAHIDRLNAGLRALRIVPLDVDWKAIARETLRRNQWQHGFLRIAVSRGMGSRGYLPDAHISANWIIECLPPAELPTAPLKLWLSSYSRPPLTSLPVNCKITHGIGSTLALLEAQDHLYDDAIMCTVDGKVCETATANLFWVSKEKIFTPALTTGCLDGTTRAAIMRVAQVEEVEADLGALHNADALFISNVRFGICPANSVKFKVSESATHFIVQDLINAFATDRASYIAAHRNDWAV